MSWVYVESVGHHHIELLFFIFWTYDKLQQERKNGTSRPPKLMESWGALDSSPEFIARHTNSLWTPIFFAISPDQIAWPKVWCVDSPLLAKNFDSDMQIEQDHQTSYGWWWMNDDMNEFETLYNVCFALSLVLLCPFALAFNRNSDVLGSMLYDYNPVP